jgi:CDP-diacylglycerol--serine O-phosphatidyltransferase
MRYSYSVRKKLPIFGYANRAMPVTFAAVTCGLLGMWLSLCGRVDAGMICLMMAGIFDMFDGPIARGKKGRVDDEKRFGIELDSLSDVINFGFVPPVMLFASGLDEWYFIPIFMLYLLAGIIRLAYFNVMALRSVDDSESLGHYVGVPITSAAGVFPLFWLIARSLPVVYAKALLASVMFIMAILFVSPVRIPKVRKRYYPLILLFIVVLVIAYVLILRKP